MIQLKKIDILFFCYVFITTILLFLSNNDFNKILELFIIRGVVLSIGIILILLNTKVKSTFISLLRNSYPILCSLLFYTETVNYNKLIFKNLDNYLIAIDKFIFGFQPSVEFSNYFASPIFSEFMYLGYFSLYIIIVSFVFITFFKLEKERDELFFKLTSCMLLFYFFFCFFPAAGPQFYFSSPEKNLPDAYLFDKIIHFIQKAEQPTGAFPSSHIGISIFILVMMKKRIKLFYNIALPFVILLIFSTIYIKAHYAIDAIAGIFSVPIMLFLTNVLYHKTPIFKL